MGAAPRPLNALLLCGGGSRGAIEIGLYKALSEHQIPIDLIVGASVGAINGALIAAGLTSDRLTALWARFEQKPLFPFNWRVLWEGWKVTGLFRTDRLVAALNSALPVRRFDELSIPLVVTATDFHTGEAVYLDSGDLLPALLASAALPPFLPPVRHQGRLLMDGAIVANMPIGEALARGATRLFAVSCHCLRELTQPPRGVLDIQARALRIAIERQMRWEIRQYQRRAELVILEPCFDFPPSPLKLAGVASLIEQGYALASAELQRRGAAQVPGLAAE